VQTRSMPPHEARPESRYSIGSATARIEGVDGWTDGWIDSVVVCGWRCEGGETVTSASCFLLPASTFHLDFVAYEYEYVRVLPMSATVNV
jgi:hypothetical protein